MDLENGLRLAVKIICMILFVLNAVVSYKEKKNGNYLKALYAFCLAIIFYVAAATA